MRRGRCQMAASVLRNRLLSLLVTGAFVLGISTPQPHRQVLALSIERQPTTNNTRSKLEKSDRERMAQARAEGKKEVVLVIASAARANASVASQVTSLGGKVRFRADDVDYLRASVPIDTVERLAKSESVATLNVNGSTFYNTSYDVEPVQISAQNPENETQIKVKPPDRNTPAENPYTPTRDIGAPQFLAKHPTFDGRGVTIAIFDTGPPDFLSPELQEATSLDGKPLRKLTGIIDAYDEDDMDHRYDRIDMRDEVLSRNGQFSFKGTAYTAVDGRYRFGVFDESAQRSPYGGARDVNLDGNPSGSSNLFCVLWNRDSNTVWVDTNQDHSFIDEKPLTDYNVRYDFGAFGRDNPNTPQRQTVTFMITAALRNDYIRLYPVLNYHATSTTSVAVGRRFLAGSMNGAAPGAQVISVLHPETNHGMIEGMILAMRNPQVNLVTCQNGSRGRLRNGNSAISIIWDRLVLKYNKPIFVGAGNDGPGANTSQELALGNKVIAVGGYVNKETLLAIKEIVADKTDNVINLSSRGPRQDGGFKPDLIAPGATLAANLPFKPLFRAGPYELPPGYLLTAGTSMAAPMAAGGAALLISAAKQTGVHFTADRLRWAMKSTARYLPGYAACDQGDGLLNVERAWDALQKVPTPVAISSVAPVNHSPTDDLRNPHQGPGIYEREGWSVGETGERRISFARSSGNAEPVQYKLEWVGNDGSFESPDLINLPLNTWISVPIEINPKTRGVHSAILRLVDPNGAWVVYEVMNVVIAAEKFSPDNGFTVTGLGHVPRLGYQSYFLKLPENTAAFKFNLHILGGNLRARFLNPAGVEYGLSQPPFSGWAPYQKSGETLTRTILSPEPGVWEVLIDNDDAKTTAVSEELKFTFEASVFAVDAQSGPHLFRPTQDGEGAVLEASFINQMAPFSGSLKNLPLGSAFGEDLSFASESTLQIYEINVPPGAETLRAQIKSTTNKNADLDLYLYDGTNKGCGPPEQIYQDCMPGESGRFLLKAFSIGSGAGEAVEVTNPNPGTWKVVVDPVSIPRGGTKLEYLDLFTHRAFGEIRSESGTTIERASGVKWKEKAQLREAAVPAARRFLAAIIEMTNDKADIVGYKVAIGGNPSGSTVQQQVSLGATVVRLRRDRDRKGNH